MTESTGVLATFGIDWKGFLAHLFNFSIVLLVMWRWVYRPLMKAMDDRSKEIQDGLKNAEHAGRDRKAAANEREDILRAARSEAQGLIMEAQARADAMHREKMAQARQEIEKIISEAKTQISSERELAFASLRTDMARLVTLATGKIAGGMSEEEQHARIGEALKEIDQVSL